MSSCGKDKGCSWVFSRILDTPEGFKLQTPLKLRLLGLGCLSSETVSPEAASAGALLWVRATPAPLRVPLCPPSLPLHSFNNLGIQCVRKKEIEAAIERKIQLGIDPYNGESPCLA